MNKLFVYLILLLPNLVNAQMPSFACNEFPPLKINTTPASGIDVDILKTIFNKQVKFTFIPWQRALLDVKARKFTGLCSCSKTEDRTFLSYSNIVDYVEIGIFYNKNLEKRHNINDFKSDKLATVRGYNLSEELSELKIKHLDVDREEQMIKMLMAKRLDAIYGYLNPLLYQMKKLNIRSKDFHYLKIKQTPYYICLSNEVPGNEKLIFKINKSLKELKANGDFDKIKNRYISQ